LNRRVNAWLGSRRPVGRKVAMIRPSQPRRVTRSHGSGAGSRTTQTDHSCVVVVLNPVSLLVTSVFVNR
jgi:hypothetical protein